jgi:hypothetical protein
VSEIVGELARTRDAFTKPTLKLLGKKYAPVVLSVFMSSFSQERNTYPADQFHALVEALLRELKSAGEDLEALDYEPARAVCRKWVSEKWLEVSSDNPDKHELYTLTSHAREAIDYVHRLAGDRSVFGESRIRTIVEAARRCATDANPNREERIASLDAQIAQLTAERDRLVDGGELEDVSADRVMEEYLDVRDLLEKLPADFLRLSEQVKAIHRIVVEEFRQEGRRAGEVLDVYLERSAQLMVASLEGRAFAGAVELLRDEALMTQLRRDLDIILAHPFAEALHTAEAVDFRNAVTGIRRGINTVLEQRRRLSATLASYITSHNPLRDRELDNLLRRAHNELGSWMQTAGPRARVELDLGLSGVEIGNMRTRFYNAADHAPPPPLIDTRSEAGAAPTLEELRQAGGPSMADLRETLVAALPSEGTVSAGEVFNNLPGALRRPVEVLGLVQIAASTGALDVALAGAGDSTETFETVRVDGSRRALVLPVIEFSQQDRPALIGQRGDGTAEGSHDE